MKTLTIGGKFIIRNLILLRFFVFGEVGNFYTAGITAVILTLLMLIYEDIKKK